MRSSATKRAARTPEPHARQQRPADPPLVDPLDPLDPASCVLRHVTRTSRAVVAAWDRALKPVGLTGQQFNLLMTLARAGDLNVKSLARLVGIDATTVPRALQPLANQGWVAVEVGEDSRERVVRLTTLGRTKFNQAKPRWMRMQRAVVAGLGGSEWSAAMNQLKRLREQLRRVDPRASR